MDAILNEETLLVGLFTQEISKTIWKTLYYWVGPNKDTITIKTNFLSGFNDIRN
jgi:hypothetical protein